MKITEYKLQHWAASIAIMIGSAILWTTISHYTERWLLKRLDGED